MSEQEPKNTKDVGQIFRDEKVKDRAWELYLTKSSGKGGCIVDTHTIYRQYHECLMEAAEVCELERGRF